MDALALDAVGQAAAIRRGEVRADELATAALAAVAAADADLHAVVTTTEDVAEEQLRAGAALAGGPLAGVPVVLKDLAVRQRGVPVGLGCRVLEQARLPAPTDTVAGARLRAAGCVTVAVSSTSPLGFGPWAGTAAGSTRTPWDPARSANGSSGGSGALVAAGAIALGTSADAAGSTRFPAAWCGAVGLKPTRGLVPTDLVDPVVVEGVITRTVRDTAAALDVLAGPVAGDLFAVASPVGSFLAQLGEPSRRLRVGVVEAFTPATDDATRAAVAEAASLLAALGHDVGVSQPEQLFEEPADGGVGSAVYALLDHFAAEAEDLRGAPFVPGELEPYIELMRGWGRSVKGSDVVARSTWIQDWSRRFLRWWDDHDLLVLPTCPVVPQPAELWEPVPGDPSAVFERWGPSLAYTEPFNRSGQPAVSLPIGWTPVDDTADRQLPVGVQLAAAPGRDLLLLQVAAALEEATGWRDRRPGCVECAAAAPHDGAGSPG